MPFPSYNFIDERISYLSFSSIQTKVKSIVLQRENVRLANCIAKKGRSRWNSTNMLRFDILILVNYREAKPLSRKKFVGDLPCVETIV